MIKLNLLAKNLLILGAIIISFTYNANHARIHFEERDPKFVWDMMFININLFSSDSLKILALFAPLYVGTRIIDHEVHSCFYSATEHKNTWQFHKNFNNSADKASMAISLGLASLAIFATDEELRRTARVFASGLLPIWLIKNIFKSVQHCGNLRPKCQYFNRYKKYYGGFPSGHMAFITFATTVFGLEYGPWWGVPLGAASIGVFAASCNSNRHFVSQLIAGTALGVLYGWSAHKILEDYENTLDCSIVSDHQTSLGVSIGYRF